MATDRRMVGHTDGTTIDNNERLRKRNESAGKSESESRERKRQRKSEGERGEEK